MALIPPGAFMVGMTVVAITNADGLFKRTWEYATTHPGDAAPFVALCSLQPLLGIPLALWAARRRGLDKRATRRWLIWAFWLGPCGSLAMLAVYPPIVREQCSECRNDTRIDFANCEHCGHSLDEAPVLGIEIFDRAEAKLATESAVN